MKKIQPISLETANALINFSGRSEAAKEFSPIQLEGAVAIHNILAREGFAYLADEVGMGKTYVALGAISLMRHFNPTLRVLYLAPRANIQQKWLKEIGNFVQNNWKVLDNRVKSIDGKPVVSPKVCENLRELFQAVTDESGWDYLTRLTSFSLPFHEESIGEYRDVLNSFLPWLPQVDLRSREAFKETYALALNAALPEFDLLVVDEGHNLKHGFSENVAARNRVLGVALGHPGPAYFVDHASRAQRVLVLSATPLETSYTELWNQMDVLGKGHLAPELADAKLSDDRKKEVAKRFLIRRLTSLEINGRRHTKNMYRREWRAGGVSNFDDPLEVTDCKQRLIVALMQKKVSDVLKKNNEQEDGKFLRSFQMGMLASFESFLETAKVAKEGEGVFDHEEQTNKKPEREGVDSPSINRIASDYRRRFNEPMPHPKMDNVAHGLASAMREGKKSLVFVRRVMSVPELVDKVIIHYDEWLKDYLKEDMSPRISAEIERCFERYRHQCFQEKTRRDVSGGEEAAFDQDDGGNDSFFSWFFRGNGSPGYLSGGVLRKRMASEAAAEAVLFQDNYALRLFGPDAISKLAQALSQTPEATRRQLTKLAYACFRTIRRKDDFKKRPVFEAYQEAFIRMLQDARGNVGKQARIMTEELYSSENPMLREVPKNFRYEALLTEPTLFSSLCQKPNLKEALWPASKEKDLRAAFREEEQRRELLSTVIRLGHPFMDIWRLVVAQHGSVIRKREHPEGDDGATDSHSLCDRFLSLLDSQKGRVGISSYSELHSVAENFHLLIDVNFPEARSLPLSELSTYFASSLSKQTPIAGMHGAVSPKAVKQFRMPGYPLVLITTDVLQEGEDLHTFCDRIFHYGISWTPSSMEQRTGRLDRIGSLTHRKLKRNSVSESDFLQVYFPYLTETVEVPQVYTILKRMTVFIRMLHENLSPQKKLSSEIELSTAMVDTVPPPPLPREELKTSFEVPKQLLIGDKPALTCPVSDEPYQKFASLCADLAGRGLVEWQSEKDRGIRTGRVRLRNGEMLAADEAKKVRDRELRVQLKPVSGQEHYILNLSTDLGRIDASSERLIESLLNLEKSFQNEKLCSSHGEGSDAFYLKIEADHVFQSGDISPSDFLIFVISLFSCVGRIERECHGLEDEFESREVVNG